MFQVHEVLPKHFLHLASHRLERSLRHRISDRHPTLRVPSKDTLP